MLLQTIKIKNLFLIFLYLLPFGNFCFRQLDVWHGTGLFFQMGILLLFSLSLFEKPNKVLIQNIPLTIFTIWLGILTSFYWYQICIKTGRYPTAIFLTYFNYLCFIIFYKLSLEYLDRIAIEKILKYLSYSVIIILFYCILQFFNLDQFFKYLGMVNHKDVVVGTIGNQSHLAGYLALCQPLFFKRNRLNYFALTFLWLIILLTQSLSGVIIGISILLFYLLFKRKYIPLISLIILSIIGIVIACFFLKDFFSFRGRIEVWKTVYPVFKAKSILGNGLGFFKALNLKMLGGTWQHAHLEYYQLLIETGIVGFSLALWCIWEYFRGIKDDLTIRLSSIFFGFCILCLFSFPAHLWSLSSMAMMAYSFKYTLKNERLVYENP